jgi:hypothetical protein
MHAMPASIVAHRGLACSTKNCSIAGQLAYETPNNRNLSAWQTFADIWRTHLHIAECWLNIAAL